MKKILLALTSGFLAFFVIQLIGQEDKQPLFPTPQVIYHINETPAIPKVSRIGINLGRWTSSGTSQLGNNILQNPGLEAEIERHIVIVSQADALSFSDEAGWGYPNSEWDRAEFQISTGHSAERRGIITRSLNSGDRGFPQYFAEKPLPAIEPNDIIVLTKVSRPTPPDLWETHYQNTASIDPTILSPQSKGTQSFKLSPSDTSKADLVYLLDAEKNIGKGLKIQGKWRFRILAKAEKPNGELFVEFKRLNGTRPFFKTTLELTTKWQEYVIDFDSGDSGPPGALKLSITAFHPSNSVWVDDLYLGKLSNMDHPFRQEVAAALKELNPSFIREYPSLGDTFENRIASPDKRKTWLQRAAGGWKRPVYSYSLPEFLSLCKEVNANPWLILSPAFSALECQKFGQYLSKHAKTSVFSEVIVEFGSENWNWLHRPTAIPYYQEQGKLARHLFAILSRNAGSHVNLTELVNGPSNSPWESFHYLDSAKNSDGLAIASYILPVLNRGTPDKEIFNEIFKKDTTSFDRIAAGVYSRGKRLALYEANFNTLKGDASSYERDRIVTGAISATALSKRLLESLIAGAHPIMVKNLAQYQTAVWDVEGFVDLWGVVRDFGPPLKFRPTGLAIKLLNQAIQGGLYQLAPQDTHQPVDQKLTLAAFRGEDSWRLAAVSESDQSYTIQIEVPDDDKKLPTSAYFLKFKSPFDNNENEDKVTIDTTEILSKNRSIYLTIPPFGVMILK